MAEKELRKYLAKKLRGHTSQLESHATAAGVPDTNTHWGGAEAWIECKFTTGGKKYKVRPAQIGWFRRRFAAGATRLWLAWRREANGETTQGIIRVDASTIETVFGDTSPSTWERLSVRVWGREIDENELNTHIYGDGNGGFKTDAPRAW